MKFTKKLKLNCLQILLFIIGLYIAVSLCKSRENWWFGTKEKEEDDTVNQMASFGAMMQEVQEIEEAEREMVYAPNKAQGLGSISFESPDNGGVGAPYCNAQGHTTSGWTCAPGNYTQQEVIDLCKSNPACKLIRERSHEGGSTYWNTFGSEYASPSTWVDSPPTGGFTNGLHYYG